MRLLIVTQAVDSKDPILGFFHEWLLEFAKQCERVHVVCLREGEHALPANVVVHSLGKEGGVSRVKYVSRFFRYAWSLRREYDAVFVHMNPEYVVLGGMLWRLSGKRIGLWYTHKSVTPLLRIAVHFADSIFTASPESFRLRSPKLRIMGHGVPAGRFLPREARGEILRICTVGRISNTKRVREMIQAVRMLNEKGIRSEFTIVGAAVTPSERMYERALREEAQDANVRFAGAVPYGDLPALLRSQDLFLHLSETGSMDKAVLDALAAGVPVLSSSEAFRDMLAPYELTIKAAPEAVAEAIARFSARTDIPLITEELRSSVHTHHSLSRLIGAIMETYERA